MLVVVLVAMIPTGIMTKTATDTQWVKIWSPKNFKMGRVVICRLGSGERWTMTSVIVPVLIGTLWGQAILAVPLNYHIHSQINFTQ